MGFYGTLKMIFYKVSRVFLLVLIGPDTSASLIISRWTRSVVPVISDAPLAAGRSAAAEDARRRGGPPETPL